MQNKTVDYMMAELKAVARKWHRSSSGGRVFNYKTTEGRRLRAAATRAMDVADGEAEWITGLQKILLSDKPFGRARELRIRLGYKNKKGGFIHSLGVSNYYVLAITRAGTIYAGTSTGVSQLAGD